MWSLIDCMVDEKDELQVSYGRNPAVTLSASGRWRLGHGGELSERVERTTSVELWCNQTNLRSRVPPG